MKTTIDTDYLTRPNRYSKLAKWSLGKLEVLDFFYPPKGFFDLPFQSNLTYGSPVWSLHLTYKTGLDKTDYATMYFGSEAEARAWISHENSQGETDIGGRLPKRLKELCGDEGDPSLLFSANTDDNLFDELTILYDSGLYEKSSQGPSKRVLDWVGDEHIEWMKKRFGDNWSVVATMEYCAEHFPRSSLVYLSAQVQFNYFVAHDDFSAGYLHRELLLTKGGAERIAVSVIEAGAKAGNAGDKKSAEKRQDNLEAFLVEIEKLGDLVGRVSDHTIIREAYANTAQKRKMPKSQKTRDDYETAHQSEAQFKRRFFAVFNKNPQAVSSSRKTLK